MTTKAGVQKVWIEAEIEPTGDEIWCYLNLLPTQARVLIYKTEAQELIARYKELETK